MEMWQELFTTASVAGATDTDATAYQAINDDFLPDAAVGTTLAPNWAYWSLGDISENDDGEAVATWNPDTFGAYALPGVDGGVAPVFAGGSNIGISAASEHQEAALELMTIIFSDEYQTILAENGLGPANTDFGSVYVDSAADPTIAQISLDTAAAAKLTPAAPGWTVGRGAAAPRAVLPGRRRGWRRRLARRRVRRQDQRRHQRLIRILRDRAGGTVHVPPASTTIGAIRRSPPPELAPRKGPPCRSSHDQISMPSTNRRPSEAPTRTLTTSTGTVAEPLPYCARRPRRGHAGGRPRLPDGLADPQLDARVRPAASSSVSRCTVDLVRELHQRC